MHCKCDRLKGWGNIRILVHALCIMCTMHMYMDACTLQLVNCVLPTQSLGAAQHHCSVIGIRYGIVGGALLVGQGYRYSASGMGGRRNS